MTTIDDREKIINGIFPCCGNKINKYLVGTKIPYCEKCNCYWTFMGVNNEFALRNDGGLAENNRLWGEILERQKNERNL